MAISSYKVFLMTSEDGTSSWEKLIDIKDFPDLGGTPELLDTTTLSDPITTNILGIQKLEALEFTCNYTLADYKKLNALRGKEKHYAVWFGGEDGEGQATPTGDQGKFKLKGGLSVYAAGSGVNSVVDMKVTIAAATPITLDN